MGGYRHARQAQVGLGEFFFSRGVQRTNQSSRNTLGNSVGNGYLNFNAFLLRFCCKAKSVHVRNPTIQRRCSGRTGQGQTPVPLHPW